MPPERRDLIAIHTYLTPRQAAVLAPGLLNVEKVRAMVRDGSLRHLKVRGRYYTTRAWVADALATLAEGGNHEEPTGRSEAAG